MSAKRRHKTMTRDAARAGSDATNANMTGCTEPVMLSAGALTQSQLANLYQLGLNVARCEDLGQAAAITHPD